MKKRLAFFSVVFVFLSLMGCLYMKGMLGKEYDYNYTYADYVFTGKESVNQYEVDGNLYKYKGGDANIYLDLSGYDTVYGISFEFEGGGEPAEVQVYYSDTEPVNYSELKMGKCSSEDSYTERFYSKLNGIRFDINEDFELKGIRLITGDSITNSTGIRINRMPYYLTVVVIAAVMSGLILLITVKTSLKNRLKKAAEQIRKIPAYIRSNYKRMIIYAAGTLLVLALSCLYEAIMLYFGADGYTRLNKYRILCMFCVLWILYTLIWFRKCIHEKLHFVFFYVCMTAGVVCIIALPRCMGVSWDDQVHFGRTAYMGYLGEPEIERQDAIEIDSWILYDQNLVREGRGDYNAMVNSIAKYGIKTECTSYAIDHKYIAYIPSAITIMIGKGLELPYTHVIMLGKLCILFCYSFLMSLALYVIKGSGKLLIAAIGLIPTNIFIASNYSYDWWVTSLTILAYALMIREIQSENPKISFKKFCGIIAIMVLACLPKAVYFPLVLPLIFMGYRYLDGGKKKYIAAAFVGMFILMGTFALPIVFKGAGEGDIRGGSGVNSAEQISFILNNPLEYTEILLNFLKTYLSLDTAKEYITNFAYLGIGSMSTIYVVTIAVVAFIDNDTNDRKPEVLTRAVTFFSAFATIVLVATALYVSFTAVGRDTIAGCQPRYIIQILFPVWYYISRCGIKSSAGTRNKAAAIMIMIAVFVFMMDLYRQLVVFY